MILIILQATKTLKKINIKHKHNIHSFLLGKTRGFFLFIDIKNRISNLLSGNE